MATHSKMHPIRAPSPPLSQQSRRNLGNPFPLTHPCDRSLQKKTHRFYVHLRFALERSFGSSHRPFVLRLQNFGRPRQTTFLWSTSSPNQSAGSTLLDNQRPHQTFPLVYQQNFIYKSVTHIKNYCSAKRKTPVKQVFFKEDI